MASHLYRPVTSLFVTFGVVARDRTDLRWQHLANADQWRERLRWARETAGFQVAEDFARRIGETGANYRKYERLPSDGDNFARTFPYQKAMEWAKVLDVRWDWLAEGEGFPWREEESSFSAEARDLAETVDQLPEGDRRAKVAAIKALLTGTDG